MIEDKIREIYNMGHEISTMIEDKIMENHRMDQETSTMIEDKIRKIYDVARGKHND